MDDRKGTPTLNKRDAQQVLTDDCRLRCRDLQSSTYIPYSNPQETLFILENAKIFGTLAGDVFQIIDKAGTLQNVIEFPPEGSFVVNSSLDWQGNGRTNFKFTAATLNLPKGRKLKLPPFGQGWFESICIDNRYRLSRDSRGDMLFVVKEGPPRKWE